MVQFQNTLEASWRRYLRSAVRLSAMTKGQKEVTIALLNLWLQHRKGPKGYIHPGRIKIAKKAGFTEKTVSRTMAVLRTAGVLCVRRRLHGEGRRPTEYTMDLLSLLELCGAEIPEWTPGVLVQIRNNAPANDAEMSHHSWTKCPTTGETKCPTATTSRMTPKTSPSADEPDTSDDGHE